MSSNMKDLIVISGIKALILAAIFTITNMVVNSNIILSSIVGKYIILFIVFAGSALILRDLIILIKLNLKLFIEKHD